MSPESLHTSTSATASSQIESGDALARSLIKNELEKLDGDIKACDTDLADPSLSADQRKFIEGLKSDHEREIKKLREDLKNLDGGTIIEASTELSEILLKKAEEDLNHIKNLLPKVLGEDWNGVLNSRDIDDAIARFNEISTGNSTMITRDLKGRIVDIWYKQFEQKIKNKKELIDKSEKSYLDGIEEIEKSISNIDNSDPKKKLCIEMIQTMRENLANSKKIVLDKLDRILETKSRK